MNPDQVAQDRFGDWNSPEAVLQAAQYCEQQREECLSVRTPCEKYLINGGCANTGASSCIDLFRDSAQ